MLHACIKWTNQILHNVHLQISASTEYRYITVPVVFTEKKKSSINGSYSLFQLAVVHCETVTLDKLYTNIDGREFYCILILYNTII